MKDLPRFYRLLNHTRATLNESTGFRAFAVINGVEDPQTAKKRINLIEAEDVEIDVVCFTPHNWDKPQPYVNKAAGWTLADIKSFQEAS
jgi:hypothetical protein